MRKMRSMEFPVHQASMKETTAGTKSFSKSLMMHHSMTAAGPSLPAYMEGETDSNVSGPPPPDPAISMLRSKGATTRAGNMSARSTGPEHERLLALEQENFQLKKDIAEKEERNKMLLARLARTEEAAKRKMRLDIVTASGVRSGGNVALQFAAEQRVVELEEKLRESVRACTREKERVLHFKALTKTAKGRLEETLRLTRTTRPANLTRQRSMSALPTARVLSMSVGGPNQQKENPPRTFVQATEEAYREKLAALEKELAAAQVDNLGLRMKMGTLEQRAPAGGGGNALPKSPLGRTASVLGPGVAELSAEVQGLRAQLAEVPRLRTEAAEAERWRREAEEVPRLRQELEELRRLAKELDEVPRLRRELADARAAAAMVADAGFGVNHRSTVQGGSFGGNKIGGESSNLSAELRTAWERVTSLQKRYDAAAEALASINGNHEKALQQLEETHRQLNQERKTGARLTARESELVLQLEAARELAPMLDTARRERLALEKENVALLAQAMAAPGSALAELKSARALLADAQKQAAEAELREAEARREAGDAQRALARAQQAEAEVREARAERDGARAELGNVTLMVDQLTEQLRQRGPGGPSGLMHRLAEAKATGASSPGGSPEQRDLKLELDELRTAFTEQLTELHTVERELHQAENTVQELKQESGSSRTKAKELEGELTRRIEKLESDLAARGERLRQVEGQLKRSLAGGSRATRKSLVASRALGGGESEWSDSESVGGGSEAGSLADLDQESNIVELRVAGASLDGAKLGTNDPHTFLTFDFYEHDTQATGVVGGASPAYGSTIQYVVNVDDFFLSYAQNNKLLVELHVRDGPDFRTVGSAGLPLSLLLGDSSGPAGRKLPREIQLRNESGELVGTLRYSLAMRRSIAKQLQTFLARPAATPARRRSSVDPLAAAVAAAAASPDSCSTVYVTINSARGLSTGRVPGRKGLVPYCSYCFPGYPVHDTRFGAGPNPHFADVAAYPFMRSAPLDAVLRAASLQVHLFDDADPDLENAGLVGTAEVPLKALIEAGGLQGELPVKDRAGKVVGTLAVGVSWRAPPLPPSAEPSGRRLTGTEPPAPEGQLLEADYRALHPTGNVPRGSQRLGGPGSSVSTSGRFTSSVDRRPDEETTSRGGAGRIHEDENESGLGRGVRSSDSQAPTKRGIANQEGAQKSTGRRRSAEQTAPISEQPSPSSQPPTPSRFHAPPARGARTAPRMRGRYSGSSDDEEVGWATPGHPRGRPLEGESSEWVAGGQPRGRPLEAESSEWVAPKRPEEKPRGGALEAESSGTSEARSSKGSRGSQVGRLQAPGGVRHSIVVGAGSPPEAGPVVSVTIHKLRLGTEAVRDPSIQRVFVLFDFLPRFVPVTDQRTQSVPKTGALLDIGFARTYSFAAAANAAARQELCAMLRSSAGEDACIPFCIVTEGATAGEYHELGFTEVDLGEILHSGRDLQSQQLEVVDRDGRPIAALEVSVVALAALRDVMNGR